MANYQKLQVSTALNIVKSDNANIPFTAQIAAGVNGSPSVNELEDVTGTFITSNVQTGDVVYNTTTGTSATVTRVISETNLFLNADLFPGSGDAFIIYSQNSPKEGCVLYIGTGGNLRVLTSSSNDVTFYNVLGGTFLPVQVLKVFSTGTSASDLVALW
jgi:hypothetical protein